MGNKAFTLIELLVVVLILGILVAIALPQYQVSVAKSQFSTLKMETKAFAEAVNRHILRTGSVPNSFDDLDVSLPIVREVHSGSKNYPTAIFNTGNHCTINTASVEVNCYLKNQKLRFDYDFSSLKPAICISINYPTGDKVCQQETNRKNPNRNDNCGYFDSNGNLTATSCKIYLYN